MPGRSEVKYFLQLYGTLLRKYITVVMWIPIHIYTSNIKNVYENVSKYIKYTLKYITYM